MSLRKALYESRRPLLMLSAMMCGMIFYRPISFVDGLTQGILAPSLIFLMLFISFCGVRLRDLRLSWLHIYLVLFQVIISPIAYYLLLPLGEEVARGGMICLLAPIAMGAVAVGALLGANVVTLISYTLLCNVVMTGVAPLYLDLFGNGECDFSQILWRVIPLLLAPMILSQLLKYSWRPAAEWVKNHGQISFYLWMGSVAVTLSRTTLYIFEGEESISISEATMLAVVALITCLLQFWIGRILGKRSGEPVAGAQSLGQKNTVLAVWLAQSFLSPISSLAPTAYIIWQNLVNSYQLYRHDRK